jgi:hypothetical protein
MGSVACDQKSKPADDSTPNSIDSTITAAASITENIDEPAATNVANKLWQKSQLHLGDTYTKANDLQAAIQNLLKNPDEPSLVLAQQKWQQTMIAYEKLSPLLYLEAKNPESLKDRGNVNADQQDIKKSSNPLVDTNLSMSATDTKEDITDNILNLEEWRNKIASWPIQPGFLDSFGPHIHSGLVNDITLLIDPHTLRTTNLMTDSEEVTLGLYAIEYLLFGDKEYKDKKNTYFKRFLEVKVLPESLAQAGLVIDELPNNRRRTLIDLQARLLVNDINMLVSLYETDGDLFKIFEQLSPLKKLQAFLLSVTNSLQNSQALFSYFEADLTNIKDTSDNSTKSIIDEAKGDTNNTQEKDLNNQIAHTEDAFNKRFINNRRLALKNNLTTIKFLLVGDEKNQETSDKGDQIVAENITLSDLLLSPEDKQTAIGLIKEIEKEIDKNNYLAKNITDKIEVITAVFAR